MRRIPETMMDKAPKDDVVRDSSGQPIMYDRHGKPILNSAGEPADLRDPNAPKPKRYQVRYVLCELRPAIVNGQPVEASVPVGMGPPVDSFFQSQPDWKQTQWAALNGKGDVDVSGGEFV